MVYVPDQMRKTRPTEVTPKLNYNKIRHDANFNSDGLART